MLRAADYFRNASLHDGQRLDDRMTEAIESIRVGRDADGTFGKPRARSASATRMLIAVSLASCRSRSAGVA